MSKPKILLFDIETSFNLVAAFDLRTEYLPYDNILKERFIICAAWKEVGASEVDSVVVTPAEARRFDDRRVVATLRAALEGADAAVGHYADRFDWPMLHSRMIKHGLPPLPKIIQIDTKKMASSKFRFNSNRLDYLGKFLGVGKKKHTDNSLWLKCLAGDAGALKKMLAYNKQDVRLLDRVFDKLRPYLPAHVNMRLFNAAAVCPSCGGSDAQLRGYTYTLHGKYQRHQCKECGSWWRDRKKC